MYIPASTLVSTKSRGRVRLLGLSGWPISRQGSGRMKDADPSILTLLSPTRIVSRTAGGVVNSEHLPLSLPFARVPHGPSPSAPCRGPRLSTPLLDSLPLVGIATGFLLSFPINPSLVLPAACPLRASSACRVLAVSVLFNDSTAG